MNVPRWWAILGLVVMLTGLLVLPDRERQAGLRTSSSPSEARGLPAAAYLASNGQVTHTPGGLWITYTEDGQGNPLRPTSFALDITTGDMWFNNGYGQIVKLSAAGQWTTYAVEDFGYGPPKSFSGVAVDAAGNAWLGLCKPWLPGDPQTEGGVLMLAPDGSWIDYTPQFDRCIYEILADRSGNTWFFERDSITRFDGESWVMDWPFLDWIIEQNYQDILTTIDRGYRQWYVEVPDRVWCFDWLIGQGVNVYDGNVWTTYTPEDGLAHDVVSYMAVGHDGRKWFSTAGGESILDDNGTLDKQDDVWTTLDIFGLDIAVDEEGKVWIAIRDPSTFEGRGVTVWDGDEWRTCDTTNSGLPHDRIHDILVDGQDIKWFGTGGGLTLLIETPYQAFLPLVTRHDLSPTGQHRR